MAQSIKLGNNTYLDASGVSVGQVDLLNAFKVLKLSDTIGALSAGDSGFRTLTGTIAPGYKALRINSIEFGHPGVSKFIIAGAGLSGTTGNISCYCPYYAYGSTAASNTDYNVLILCVKSEMNT